MNVRRLIAPRRARHWTPVPTFDRAFQRPAWGLPADPRRVRLLTIVHPRQACVGKARLRCRLHGTAQIDEGRRMRGAPPRQRVAPGARSFSRAGLDEQAGGPFVILIGGVR
ncbi:hypothetical protein GCM10007301_32730 [Azorhizobium oxalatiphilum]|uniref:Uncharacterized protein n=1 Tax=Azorhizobium oxalatiphilum TaxID=980631 RepID=A0A917FEL1_9HYPH|nr:hypothetical protein GCM10007301_32730 [Azorhizobium oxalatiphilum]